MSVMNLALVLEAFLRDRRGGFYCYACLGAELEITLAELATAVASLVIGREILRDIDHRCGRCLRVKATVRSA
jgi:hypothetical protein